MYALLWLIPVTLVLVLAGLALFAWSVRSGQFDDLDGAAWRILDDEDGERPARPGRRTPPPG